MNPCPREPKDPMLSLREAAEHMGVSVDTVRDMVRDRLIPFTAVSVRRLRVRLSDVENYIPRHTYQAVV